MKTWIDIALEIAAQLIAGIQKRRADKAAAEAPEGAAIAKQTSEIAADLDKEAPRDA